MSNMIKNLNKNIFTIKSLIVFNDGGLELNNHEFRDLFKENYLEKNNKKNKMISNRSNIVINNENLSILSYLKDYKIFYYFGETFENKRHGWGFLANDKNIIYEGMWYLDKAIGWYILYDNFKIEFGHRDNFNDKHNNQSYIYFNKEAEIILNNKFNNNNNLYLKFVELSDYLREHFSENRNISLKDMYTSLSEFSIDINNKYLFSLDEFKKLDNENVELNNKLNLFHEIYEKLLRLKENEILLISDKINNCYSFNLNNRKDINSKCTLYNNMVKLLVLNYLLKIRLFASECLNWNTETISRILLSIGLINEAIIFQKSKIMGIDIPKLTEKVLEDLGISNNYSRKFILRLFRLFWNCLDYTDLRLKENMKIKMSTTLPYISSSSIKFGNYIGSGAYSLIRKGLLNNATIICKIYFFNTENYEKIDLDKIQEENDLKIIFEYHYPDLFNKIKDNKNLLLDIDNPICYIYKYRIDSIFRSNIYKYVPTPIKLRNWEGRILRFLTPHPNIVNCIGITQIREGCEVLLLEYCEGSSIDQYLFNNNIRGFEKMKSKFSASRLELLSWLRDIANGMKHVHENGVLHRDLKLSNFFVSKFQSKYIGKVGDFGIAVTIESDLNYSNFSEFGNVYYAAPEVLRGEGFYKESDVWSFGVSFLEVITKSLAFDGFIPGLTMIINANNIQVLEHPSNTPNHLIKLIKMMLNPDWRKRPSFKYISEEISRIIENTDKSFIKSLSEFHAIE